MTKNEFPGSVRLWATVVLIAVFVIGAASGAALWHLLTTPKAPPPPMMGPIPIHELNLSEAQHQKAREIFDAHRPELDAVLEETFPKVQAVNEKIEKDLLTVLDEGQRERFLEIKSRRQKGFGDRPHFPGHHRGRHDEPHPDGHTGPHHTPEDRPPLNPPGLLPGAPIMRPDTLPPGMPPSGRPDAPPPPRPFANAPGEGGMETSLDTDSRMPPVGLKIAE